jgi:hypothetical protein
VTYNEITSLEIKTEKKRNYYKETRHDFGKRKLHVLTCFFKRKVMVDLVLVLVLVFCKERRNNIPVKEKEF